MKILLVVLLLALVPQNAVASIFDSFKQTLSSIATSVEKMINTVASDVKETFDCTLLALEHSLSITLFKEYNKKCKGIDDINNGIAERDDIAVEHINEEFSEFEAKAKTKLKRICGIPVDELDLDKIREVLLHNSGRLQRMDAFLKKQLAALPQNLDMMDSILKQDTECSVEEVMNKIKALIDMVMKVNDQKIGDEIEDVLKEILKLLYGDDLVSSSGVADLLQSGLTNTAAMMTSANKMLLLEPKTNDKQYYEDANYDDSLVDHNAQTEMTFVYDGPPDDVAEETTDYVDVNADIYEQDQYIEPLSSVREPPNNPDSDIRITNNREIDTFVTTANDIVDENDFSENENISQSAEDTIPDFPPFPSFSDSMPSDTNPEQKSESMFPDDDLMMRIREIMTAQQHTELMMGNLKME